MSLLSIYILLTFLFLTSFALTAWVFHQDGMVEDAALAGIVYYFLAAVTSIILILA